MKNLKLNGLFVFMIAILMVITTACGSTSSSSKTLKVISDAEFPPFEQLQGDKIVGFDADLLAAVMKEAGLKYNISNMGWDALLVDLKNGKDADAAMSAVTITKDREKSYDFSRPYYKAAQLILTKKGSPIRTALDLKGKLVAVQTGTTGDDAAKKILGKKNLKIKGYETGVLACMSLLNGDVDAVVIDDTVAKAFIQNNPGKDLEVISDPANFAPEYYGVLLPKGSKYKDQINKALNAVLKNGTYSTIYKKWFKVDPTLSELDNVTIN